MYVKLFASSFRVIKRVKKYNYRIKMCNDCGFFNNFIKTSGRYGVGLHVLLILQQCFLENYVLVNIHRI